MPRTARIVVEGMPHHIVQRGNRRQNVFFNTDDRMTYISLLKKACDKHNVKIWAWCLMRNHVHFIAVPQKKDALSKCFASVHVKYTRRINARNEWKGYLWQGRFVSKVLDERHLLARVRYIEQNPTEAGIVRYPWDYEWSSAAYHAGVAESDLLVKDDENLKGLIDDWKSFLLT